MEATSDGGTALMKAAAQGHIETVEALIAAGANIDSSTGLGTALIQAANKERIEIVKILIAHNAKLDAKTEKGETALMKAEESNHAEIVKLLKEAGAKE
jgi:ankyrin repeat protein